MLASMLPKDIFESSNAAEAPKPGALEAATDSKGGNAKIHRRLRWGDNRKSPKEAIR